MTELSPSILNRNCAAAGEFLIKKYLAKNNLFNVTSADLPIVSTMTGHKELILKSVRAKGVTIKRTAGGGATKELKSDSQRREDQRHKVVKSAVLRVQSLTSI